MNGKLPPYYDKTLGSARIIVKSMRRRSLGLAIIASSLAGCAVATYKNYAPQSSDQQFVEQQVDGLVVRVQTIVDQGLIDDYLGADLLARGILPVFIVLQNRGATSRYIIQKQDFRIADVSASAASRNSETDSREGTAVAWAGVVLLSPVLILIGGKMFGDAVAAEQNMIKQELRSDTLSSGQETSGFLYFPVGERPIVGKAYRLLGKASDSQTGKQIEFSVELRVAR